MSTKLPFDEGYQAYHNKINSDFNPYSKGDWRHEEWWLGWRDAETTDQDQSYDHATDSFKDSGDSNSGQPNS